MDHTDTDIMDPDSAARKGRGPESAKQPWNVEVDVYLTKACPNPEFEICSSLPVQNGNIVFQNNHRPGFNITFNLYDETGSNYVFPTPPNIQEACWSQVGSTCPTTPVWEVLEPRQVKNGGTTLVVYNDNPSPPLGDFQYTLRVTNDGGATYCALDPGGSDMNGARN